MNEKRHQAEIDALKRKLDKMLQQQVLVSGISARYITSGLGAAGVVDQLLGGKGACFPFPFHFFSSLLFTFFLPLFLSFFHCLFRRRSFLSVVLFVINDIDLRKGNDHLLGLEKTHAVDDMNLRGKKGKKVVVKRGKRGKSQKTAQ